MNNNNIKNEPGGKYISIDNTRLYIVERGQGYPIIILHGGPGMDHHMFGDYLDALTDKYKLIFVDQRSQGRSDMTPEDTWTLEQMAQDSHLLATAMNLEDYVILGHSFGALVALQHAVNYPESKVNTIISSGFPSSKFLDHVAFNLEIFEPKELREKVAASWEREKSVETEEDVFSLLKDQMPFHFADPLSPLLDEYLIRSSGAKLAPRMLRHFAQEEYGGIEVQDQLQRISVPMLVLVGRHDRICSVKAAEAIANGVKNSELVIFENSGHMTFVEENDLYISVVRNFLEQNTKK
jgi:pimeloyl-ACP methyl ester carboxylesterase